RKRCAAALAARRVSQREKARPLAREAGPGRQCRNPSVGRQAPGGLASRPELPHCASPTTGADTFRALPGSQPSLAIQYQSRYLSTNAILLGDGCHLLIRALGERRDHPVAQFTHVRVLGGLRPINEVVAL